MKDINQETSQRAMEIINRVFGDMMSCQPAHTFWENRKTKDRYFYTKEKINHKGSPRYVAGIYRYLKSKKNWKLVKKVGFSKKKRAIAWAYKKYQEASK